MMHDRWPCGLVGAWRSEDVLIKYVGELWALNAVVLIFDVHNTSTFAVILLSPLIDVHRRYFSARKREKKTKISCTTWIQYEQKYFSTIRIKTETELIFKSCIICMMVISFSLVICAIFVVLFSSFYFLTSIHWWIMVIKNMTVSLWGKHVA